MKEDLEWWTFPVFHHTAKISWIKRLSGNYDKNWKSTMFKRMGIRVYQLNKKLDPSITKIQPNFINKYLLHSYHYIIKHQKK